MNENRYNAPTIRSIVLGILLFVVILLAVGQSSDLVKLIGAPFLFLPAKLGLIGELHREDIVVHDVTRSPSQVSFPRAGQYQVFTGDGDLLHITLLLEGSHAEPWLVITEAATGQALTLEYVSRGLHIYDTPLVDGRPIFTLDVPRAGQYNMIHTARPAKIAFVPDYTTGKGGVLLFAFGAQIALLLAPLGYLYYNRVFRRRKVIHEQQMEKRKQVDSILESLRGKPQRPTKTRW